jgi:hypothetical protein
VAQVRVQVAYRLGGQEWRSIILTVFKSYEAALNWLDPFVSPPPQTWEQMREWLDAADLLDLEEISNLGPVTDGHAADPRLSRTAETDERADSRFRERHAVSSDIA